MGHPIKSGGDGEEELSRWHFGGPTAFVIPFGHLLLIHIKAVAAVLD
jgi:hypothetical protein